MGEKVRLAVSKCSGVKYAIKTYEKSKLTDHQKRKNVTREIKILSKLRHPNIIKLNSAAETSS
jgi:serine/threonine protein kinase